MEKKILHLTLTKKWFDMIVSGAKKEEYREIKPYWIKRLRGKQYTHVRFRNGYRADSPVHEMRITGIIESYGVSAWGAPVAEPVFIIRLREIRESGFCAGRIWVLDRDAPIPHEFSYDGTKWHRTVCGTEELLVLVDVVRVDRSTTQFVSQDIMGQSFLYARPYAIKGRSVEGVCDFGGKYKLDMDNPVEHEFSMNGEQWISNYREQQLHLVDVNIDLNENGAMPDLRFKADIPKSDWWPLWYRYCRVIVPPKAPDKNELRKAREGHQEIVAEILQHISQEAWDGMGLDDRGGMLAMAEELLELRRFANDE